VGAALPLVLTWLSPSAFLVPAVGAGSLVCLALLGGLAANAGGASVVVGAGRVTLWGALAMAATAVIGRIFGATG
jgi:VIT1/CCC1 family predicted Fe2+/Mn2+ transporter